MNFDERSKKIVWDASGVVTVDGACDDLDIPKLCTDISQALKEAFEAGWEKAIDPIIDLVDEQAEDEGLWFVARVQILPEGETKDYPISISEDYLQQALRKLHAVVENQKGTP